MPWDSYEYAKRQLALRETERHRRAFDSTGLKCRCGHIAKSYDWLLSHIETARLADGTEPSEAEMVSQASHFSPDE